MAFVGNAMCTSFKAEILQAVHDFRTVGSGGDTFKLALYTSSATIDANTTAYTATNEVSGANYTAGGNSLVNGGVTATNTNATAGTGFTTFSNTTWTNANITARGALIYNNTPAVGTNAAVAVLDFGTDKTSTAGDFTIIFPVAANTTAIIRIA
jgi:hypothetical protein